MIRWHRLIIKVCKIAFRDTPVRTLSFAGLRPKMHASAAHMLQPGHNAHSGFQPGTNFTATATSVGSKNATGAVFR